MSHLRKAAAILASILITFTPLNAQEGDNTVVMIDSDAGRPYKELTDRTIANIKKHREVKIIRFRIGNSLSHARRIFEEIIIKRNINLVYTAGTIATISALNHSKKHDFKIVSAAATDPIGIGMDIKFGEHPCCNMTAFPYFVDIEDRLDLVLTLFPTAKTIGYLYADMPQSISYLKMLKTTLKKQKYNHLKLVAGKVEFVSSEGGYKRMISIARNRAIEIMDEVDLFMSPSDQMGTKIEFSQMIYTSTGKPIIGISKDEVEAQNGAIASIYPDLKDIADRAANAVIAFIDNAATNSLIPRKPKSLIILNKSIINDLGISVPDKYKHH